MEHLWEREGRRNGGLTDERTVPSFVGFYRLEQTRFFYTSHTLKVRLPGSYINISNVTTALCDRQAPNELFTAGLFIAALWVGGTRGETA